MGIILRISGQIDRLFGLKQIVDLRRPIDPRLKIGPLAYGQWEQAMDGVFQSNQERSPLVAAYHIETVDELLTFSYQKALKRGMVVDNDQVELGNFKPRLDPRWRPTLELWPQLNRKAAKLFGFEANLESMSRFTGYYLHLRTVVAQLNLGEQPDRELVTALNLQAKLIGINIRLNI